MLCIWWCSPHAYQQDAIHQNHVLRVLFRPAHARGLRELSPKRALPAIPSVKTLVCLLLLGLLPTTMSNICVIMALKKISATMVSVLGAFEPLTAMSVGILVFGEPLTINVGVGFLLVIAAVILLILTSGKAETSPKRKGKGKKK